MIAPNPQFRPPEPEPFRPVRPVPALIAPFTVLGSQIAELVRLPLAFFGGLFGMLGLCAALLFGFVYFPSAAVAAGEEDAVDEEEFELEFEPGALVRLGPKPTENMPEKQIVRETRVAEDAVEATVTTNEEAAPDEEKEPDKQPDPEKKKSRDKVDPNKKKDVVVDDKNREKNTPYDDLPNVDELSGDPFGDPRGWADMKKDGDPWATDVMAALNGMEVPSYAARGFKGQYGFEIKICQNGTISQVFTKKPSGNPDLDNAVRGELLKTKIPKPPAAVKAKMKSDCVKLKYTFYWGQGVVK